MIENILEYLIITAIGGLISVAGWLWRLWRRVLDNTSDIEKLIQLAAQKEQHRQERHQSLDRRMQSIEGKIDALQLMLMQFQQSQVSASAASDSMRVIGGKKDER